MNGVGGNLVAVQASRLSTGLHQLGKPGQVQEKSKFHGCTDTFFGSGMVPLFDKKHLILIDVSVSKGQNEGFLLWTEVNCRQFWNLFEIG